MEHGLFSPFPVLPSKEISSVAAFAPDREMYSSQQHAVGPASKGDEERVKHLRHPASPVGFLACEQIPRAVTS